MSLYRGTAIMFNKSFASQKGGWIITLHFLWITWCYWLMHKAYWHNHSVSQNFCLTPFDAKPRLPASSNEKFIHMQNAWSPIQYEISSPGGILQVIMTKMSSSDSTFGDIFLPSIDWIRATRWSDKTCQDSVLWLFFSKYVANTSDSFLNSLQSFGLLAQPCVISLTVVSVLKHVKDVVKQRRFYTEKKKKLFPFLFLLFYFYVIFTTEVTSV